MQYITLRLYCLPKTVFLVFDSLVHETTAGIAGRTLSRLGRVWELIDSLEQLLPSSLFE